MTGSWPWVRRLLALWLWSIVISERQPTAWLVPPIFGLAPEVASRGSRPCNFGRCAIPCIHPNVPTPGPPTSRAVQVNLREGPGALRRCGRPVRTELGTRLHPVMSLLLMRGIDPPVQQN
jgi:hypothetical protein